MQPLAQTPAIPGAVGVANLQTLNKRFVLAIDGLDCSGVQSISAITVRIPSGGAPLVSNVILKMQEKPSVIAAWKTWFETLSANPDQSDANEKQGTLQIADRRNVLLTLGLRGLGVVRMSRSNLNQICPLGYVTQEIELYCEAVTVQPQSAPPAPVVKKYVHEGGGKLQLEAATEPQAAKPTLTPVVPAPPGATPPAPGTAEDKGARDPEGAPRFPGCVRTSFTANRLKGFGDEIGEYVTKSDPAKVEAFFTEEMKNRKWSPTTRQESGADATYRIDVRWEREKQQAKVLIGKAKDGSTTILVSVTTLTR